MTERKDIRLRSFPIVKEDQLKQAIANQFARLASFGEDRLYEVSGMSTSDPHLMAFIEDLTSHLSTQEESQVKQGANFTYMAIEGWKLPRVSKKTLKSYFYGWKRGANILMEELMSTDEMPEPLELMRTIRSNEASWPYAYDYAEDDHLLFGFILRRSEAFKVGATIVYQLKKAQFESRKLTRTMNIQSEESSS